MIRFVDLTRAYYAIDADKPATGYPSICAFINTVSDTFVYARNGDTIFNSEKEVAELGERYLRVTPKGFWERSTT